MSFNGATLAVLATIAGSALACGSVERHPHSDNYQAPPSSHSGAGLWTGDSANLLVTIEHLGETFSLFHLPDPFMEVQTLPLPFSETSELILPSPDGQYFLAASTSNYAVVQAGGAVNQNPLAMQGSPQTVAYSPTTHVAVLTDDRQAMVLLQLDAAGNVKGTWASSTQFPNGQYALSGAMLTDGTYAATLSTDTVAVVDVVASIAKKSWSVTKTFSVDGASNMFWAATIPLPALGFRALLVQDADRLLTLNIDTGKIVGQKAIGSASVLWRASDLSPHVITQAQAQIPANTHDLSYVDATGQIATATYQGTSEQIVASWLDTTSGVLAVAFDPQLQVNASIDPYSNLGAERTIVRFHTKDGSTLDTSTLTDSVRVKLRSDYIFTTYPAALGKAERLTYGSSPQTATALRYALPAVSKRYQKK